MPTILVRLIGPFFALMMASSPVTAAGTIFLGDFSNIRKSPMSSDCDGYSLSLWVQQGEVSGWFYEAAGTCPGVRSRISEAIYDSKAGMIDVLAKSPYDDSSWRLVGKLKPASLEGELEFKSSATAAPQTMGLVSLKRLKHVPLRR